MRTRLTTSTTTTSLPIPPEEDNTEQIIRRRFRPKDPRHGSSSTTESSERNSEYHDIYANSRLRPINRKSTDVKPKVSIRPNLFSTKRRPPIGLRNKGNKTNDEITTTEEIETTEMSAETSSDIGRLSKEDDNDFQSMVIPGTDSPKLEGITTALTEDDYSKRVSDLTSSLNNEYNSGFFKSVPSNSRKIPNHFTISTDDPILPIEAFFTNIKE